MRFERGINCRLFVTYMSYVRSNGVSVPSDSPVFLNVLRCAARNCRRAEPFRVPNPKTFYGNKNDKILYVASATAQPSLFLLRAFNH